MNTRPVHYELLPQEYTRERKCAQCGVTYVEGDHIGRLACWVHPGVRLTDWSGDSRFSCCDRRTEEAGCLAIDHCDLIFSRASIETRLAQLQHFAIKVYPAVLSRYLPAPRHQCVVYRLPERWSERPIVLEFDVLAHALRRHRQALLGGARLLYDQDAVTPTVFDPRVTRSPQALLEALAEQAKHSELFTREMSTRDVRGLEIERLCNETWKNLAPSGKSKLDCTIQFSLVRRLGGT